MEGIVKREAKTSKALLSSNFLSILDSVEGKIDCLNSPLIQFMMLIFLSIKHLSDVSLIIFDVETVSSKDNESDPGPHDSKDRLIE
jgi:hypothetical protein